MHLNSALLTLGLCLGIVLAWALLQSWTRPPDAYDVPDRLDDAVEHVISSASFWKYDMTAILTAAFAHDVVQWDRPAMYHPRMGLLEQRVGLARDKECLCT